MSTADPKLFISYRRAESAGHAGRIYDAVAARFGDQGVFMDVTIAPGKDFVEQVERAVGACHVLLAVIGPNWATISRGDGPRLAAPDDFVRLEVETALHRSDVMILPVLVGGARMPEPAQLPERLRSLTRVQALELSDQRWSYDLGRLMDVLQQRLGDATGVHAIAPAPKAAAPKPTPSAAAAPGATALVLQTMLVAAVASLAGYLLLRGLHGPPSSESHGSYVAGQIAATLARRGIVWAAVGAAVGGWLVFARGERAVTGAALTGALLGAGGGLLGGLIFAIPGFVDGLHEADDTPTIPNDHLPTVNALEKILSIGVTAALVGCLLGMLWQTRRSREGLLIGFVAGAVIQTLFVAAGIDLIKDVFPNPDATDTRATVLVVLQAAAICGAVVAGLAALDRSQPAGPLQPAGDRRRR